MNINEVTYKDIKLLNDVPLSDLLLTLLTSESQHFKFKGITEIIVPLRINVGDAGDDGRVSCEDTNGSRYITNGNALFQCKATDLSPQEIFDEFFSVNIKEKPEVLGTEKKKGRKAVTRQLELKAKIKEVLDAGGQYIFFIRHDYNSKLLKSRVEKAQEALSVYNELHGTKYSPDQVRVMEGNEIAGWTNNYINAVTKVQGHNGIHRPDGLKAMTELDDFLSIHNIAFHSNTRLDQHIKVVQKSAETERSVLRVIGHSGLGKTRLVYEALKASGLIEQAAYFDIVSDGQNIVNFVRTYGKRFQGIIIVDNCEYHIHKALKEEVTRQGGTFRLITIDYNVAEEFDKSKTNGENYIFLNNEQTSDIVKKILEDQFEGRLDRSHISQIAEYSEGYPGMAVLFANARVDGMNDLSELLGDENIARLAFGRDWATKDETKFDILQACSIFSHFGRPASNAIQYLSSEEKTLYANQRDLIITKICDPARSKRDFSQSTEYFENRRVMERRGNFLSVKPTPLAVKLALNWWKHFDQSELQDLFPKLEELGMAIPLVNRLSELDQLSEAKQIVNGLLGENSPFGSAEVLNTTLGSRLFRSIASVNPETSMNTIERVFGQISLQTLKSDFGPGRRYIIWALEVLAFRKDYFQRAARQLFRFAAAENENISNNATGQLLQLFHIVLAGTEADLDQRLEVIDEHLNNENETIVHLAVSAMIRGMKGDSFRRDIGAEKQGSGPHLIDFTPTWAQSAQYWDSLIERLLNIARENSNERERIKSGLPHAFRNLYYNNLGPLVEKCVKGFLEFDKAFWEEAINQLKASLQYETVNQDDQKNIHSLLGLLEPQTIEDQVKFYVSLPSWQYSHKSEEDYVDYAQIEAEKFADRLVASHVNLIDILPMILRGEQRKGLAFGKRLGQATQDMGIAREMLKALAEVEKTEQNPDAIAGFISELPKQERNQLLKEILADENLALHAIFITRVQQPDLSEVMSLFTLLDSTKIDIRHFYQFTYGRGLDSLTPDEVMIVFQKLSSYDHGAMVALELSQQYIGKDEQLWNKFKPFIRTLIADNNLLLRQSASQAKYSWSQAVERLFEDSHDISLMESITQQIRDTGRLDRISSIDHYLYGVVQKIIIADFSMFWSIIGPEILDNSTYLNYKYFLGSKNGERASLGLLEYANYDLLLKWAKDNSPQAPKRLGYMMPVTVRSEPSKWHPLATLAIAEFGSVPGFLQELGSNIHSFGSVGSQIPYLNDQLSIFEQLLEHPNKEVRIWARKEVDGTRWRIERAALEEPGEFLDY